MPDRPIRENSFDNLEANCGKQRSFYQRLICRLRRGNLMTVLIGLLLVLAGRFFILSVAARIPDQPAELVVHKVHPLVFRTAEAEAGIMQQPVRLTPFDRLNDQNHIKVRESDVTATDNYWNLDWWTQYILKKMPQIQTEMSLAKDRSFLIYREDNVKPQSGVRTGQLTSEWLLSEGRLISQSSQIERTWTLKTAWSPEAGLSYFRLDSPQYLHGELKADQAILDQASSASRVFLGRLTDWVRSVTNTGVRPPVVLPDSRPGQPSEYKMEGLICHVIFEGANGESSFIVYYNVAIMQVVGFAAV